MTESANMIVFQSDNHNRAVSGCYGHPIVKTPNIDRIAAAGVRFNSAYCASPLCCPSRASIATGRYPHQTGYWDNAIVYDGRIPSWMHRLRAQGHPVVAVGKLHFRSTEDDNGFTEGIETMHLHGGKGAIKNLLRGYGQEPVKDESFRDLYTQRSGAGNTHYQDYDRRITAHAIEWLGKYGRQSGKPWVLYVSYVSPHPPFTVPQRIYDLYPEGEMPLPRGFRAGERPKHPAVEFLRYIENVGDISDEGALRRIAAGYFGLITHLDEQIGEVLRAAEGLGLLANTRLAYTSDHGELFGAKGVFGKKNLYEDAVGVPLVMCGPGIPRGRVSRRLVSHVDLFPTLVESAGAKLAPEDASLPGASLWPAITGEGEERAAFAEYHAQGSKAAAYMVCEANMKLIHHVGMPAQLFDLAQDPDEAIDLAGTSGASPWLKRLTDQLHAICDPVAVDERAKADQRAMVER